MNENIEKISSDIGDRFKKKRESLGFSVFEVAKRLSVKSDTIKGLESGKGLIQNFIRYANLLHEEEIFNFSKSIVPASITFEELFKVLNRLKEERCSENKNQV